MNSRLVWYPLLAVMAAYCAEPLLAHGTAGLPEMSARLALQFGVIFSTPCS